MEYIKTNPTSESKMYKFQRLISIVQETDPVGADPSHEFYLTLWIWFRISIRIHYAHKIPIYSYVSLTLFIREK